MRRLSVVVVVLLSTLCLPASARAQASGLWLNVGAGGTRDAVNSGGAFTTGLSVKGGPVIATFTPVDLILSPGDTPGYFRDSDDVCRESNGRFAEDERCSAVDVQYALTGDVGVVIPKTPIFIGGGARYDRQKNPWYGVVGVQGRLSERGMWSIRFNVGPNDYLSGIAAVSIRVAGF